VSPQESRFRAMKEVNSVIVGVPKEIKNNEFRVGLTPGSVREFIHHGHSVVVETCAGDGSSFPDSDYVSAGATILGSADEVFSQADMIVKVKEPQAVEIARLRPGQILYTYLHLAPDFEQTVGLVASKAVCIAYETDAWRRSWAPSTSRRR
jgi:alanine dehydrogenase